MFSITSSDRTEESRSKDSFALRLRKCALSRKTGKEATLSRDLRLKRQSARKGKLIRQKALEDSSLSERDEGIVHM